MKSFDGYLRQTAGDTNLLLAGGGTKPLSDFFDTTTSDGRYVKKTGDDMSGALHIKADAAYYHWNPAGTTLYSYIGHDPNLNGSWWYNGVSGKSILSLDNGTCLINMPTTITGNTQVNFSSGYGTYYYGPSGESSIEFMCNGTSKAVFGATSSYAFMYNRARTNYLKYNDNGTLTFEGNIVLTQGNWTSYISLSNVSASTAVKARYVEGDADASTPGGALLRSGAGRPDSSPAGDTWIFHDTLGGTSSYWGIRHNLANNSIGFCGLGTEWCRIPFYSGVNGYIGSAMTIGSNVDPSYTLDVRGNGRFTNNIQFTETSASTDLSVIPVAQHVAITTGNGNGVNSAWIWRENYSSSNWGIFHNNSTDWVYVVGNNTVRFGVPLGGGNVIAAGYGSTSDIKYKLDVKDISNILPIRSFIWKDTLKRSYGFIALELEKLGYNELVEDSTLGKTVNYPVALSLFLAKLSNIVEENNNSINSRINMLEKRILDLELENQDLKERLNN